MHPYLSAFVEVADVPHAGRGVVTIRPVPAGTLVHASAAPAIHVIFREYRKEVCAYCFHYDRGRTLAVRESELGKVFCCPDCRLQWTREQGEVGVTAWRALEAFIRAQHKPKTTAIELPEPLLLQRPDADNIAAAWSSAAEAMQADLTIRPSGRKHRRKVAQAAAAVVEPDMLAFLLSAALLHHGAPEQWRRDVMALAMDATPYASYAKLAAHCTAQRQLAMLVPAVLRPSIAPSLAAAAIAAASHNAFGLRAGGADREEYLGYAVYPSASYFNHSCRPNIAKERVGRVWQFRALVDLHGPGVECCISYFGGDEDDMTVAERRSRSAEIWGFSCTCQRCVEEEEASRAG